MRVCLIIIQINNIIHTTIILLFGPLIECTWNLSYLLQSAVLFPVNVIDALIEARGSLITPEGRAHARSLVRESAVPQLKQLVPLHGEVSSRSCASKANGIMHDMLNSAKPSVRLQWANSYRTAVCYSLTSFPSVSPYLNSHTGVCSLNTEIMSESLITGIRPSGSPVGQNGYKAWQ